MSYTSSFNLSAVNFSKLTPGGGGLQAPPSDSESSHCKYGFSVTENGRMKLHVVHPLGLRCCAITYMGAHARDTQTRKLSSDPTLLSLRENGLRSAKERPELCVGEANVSVSERVCVHLCVSACAVNVCMRACVCARNPHRCNFHTTPDSPQRILPQGKALLLHCEENTFQQAGQPGAPHLTGCAGLGRPMMRGHVGPSPCKQGHS